MSNINERVIFLQNNLNLSYEECLKLLEFNLTNSEIITCYNYAINTGYNFSFVVNKLKDYIK